MKALTTFSILLSFGFCAFAASKPDYIVKNPDGSVKTRGVYEVDDTGRVLKFTLHDGSGALLHTEIPYYAPDGRLIRADRLDTSGKLLNIVVYFDSFLKVLDPDGNVVDTQLLGKEKE